MENSLKIFSIALGLSSPWEIENIEINKESLTLNIHLKFTRGYKFRSVDGNQYTAHYSLAGVFTNKQLYYEFCG